MAEVLRTTQLGILPLTDLRDQWPHSTPRLVDAIVVPSRLSEDDNHQGSRTPVLKPSRS